MLGKHQALLHMSLVLIVPSVAKDIWLLQSRVYKVYERGAGKSKGDVAMCVRDFLA